jgi:hypothetical protein
MYISLQTFLCSCQSLKTVIRCTFSVFRIRSDSSFSSSSNLLTSSLCFTSNPPRINLSCICRSFCLGVYSIHDSHHEYYNLFHTLFCDTTTLMVSYFWFLFYSNSYYPHALHPSWGQILQPSCIINSVPHSGHFSFKSSSST